MLKTIVDIITDWENIYLLYGIIDYSVLVCVFFSLYRKKEPMIKISGFAVLTMIYGLLFYLTFVLIDTIRYEIGLRLIVFTIILILTALTVESYINIITKIKNKTPKKDIAPHE